MDELFTIHNRLLASVKLDFQRSLLTDIDWNLPLIEVRGSRGVGKTTLMLQQAKLLQQQGVNVLYASLDTPYFFTISLVELADQFTKFGGTHLFLDEVHRYPAKFKDSDWSLELKNLVDAYPKLKIVYSGSSILHLYKGKGDLSRRKASYLLNGLSFREYLQLSGIKTIERYGLSDLLSNHQEIAAGLIGDFKPLLHFRDYLNTGYYPFYSGNEGVYFKQLQDVINLTIDADLPYLTPVSHGAREQLKRLLGAISTTVPYVPNMSRLADMLGITDHRTLMKYIQLLDEAQILNVVRSHAKGNKALQKPEKILIENTNLMRALGMSMADVGTIRETFFFNQLAFKHAVSYSGKADFLIDNTILIEIGGTAKKKKQLENEPNAFVVKDGIELGFGNIIPLWMMGLLY
jgi:uncharacterized protein